MSGLRPVMTWEEMKGWLKENGVGSYTEVVCSVARSPSGFPRITMTVELPRRAYSEPGEEPYPMTKDMKIGALETLLTRTEEVQTRTPNESQPFHNALDKAKTALLDAHRIAE